MTNREQTITEEALEQEVSRQMAIIQKGAHSVINPEDLRAKLTRSLRTGIPLTVKFGLDPSAPDIHLGHAVVLRKLRQIQDLGHQIVIIIGDFTGKIGDPTGKSKGRKALTDQEVLINAQTYQEQVFHILDESKTTLRYNGEWLELLTMNDVICPDEGALDRGIYFANVLGVDTGMFYKRRDYSTIVNGKNPIVAHEFLGDNIDGKDAIIIDDMISSGGSMIDTARQLKKMNAKRVFICCTFGLFTDGLAAFDEAYEKCYFDRIITTNLCYQPPMLREKPYYLEADMSKFLASIIDFMNHDASMSNIYTPTDKIHQILNKYNNREVSGLDL